MCKWFSKKRLKPRTVEAAGEPAVLFPDEVLDELCKQLSEDLPKAWTVQKDLDYERTVLAELVSDEMRAMMYFRVLNRIVPGYGEGFDVTVLLLSDNIGIRNVLATIVQDSDNPFAFDSSIEYFFWRIELINLLAKTGWKPDSYTPSECVGLGIWNQASMQSELKRLLSYVIKWAMPFILASSNNTLLIEYIEANYDKILLGMPIGKLCSILLAAKGESGKLIDRKFVEQQKRRMMEMKYSEQTQGYMKVVDALLNRYNVL